MTHNTQASQWLAKLQRDDVSSVEREAFEHWLDADPAHAVAFARTEFAWDRAQRLRANPAIGREVLPARPRHLWKMAAGIAAVTLTAAAWYGVSHWHVYTTGLGERRTVSLADGSQINLNTQSRIDVDFDDHARTIHLTVGEALFKVALDAKRPFVVQAGQTQVRAVGTAFNVRLKDQLVEVTVTEGAVAVNQDRIAAGSAVVATGNTINRVSLSEDALHRRVVWRDGVIELRGETLDQAVAEFNRYRKSKLIVADPAIANLRVGGRFETDEGGKFVNALKASFSIRAVKGDGEDVYLLGPQ